MNKSNASSGHCQVTTKSLGREEVRRAQEQDDKEEKTVEVNADDEFLASGYFPVEDDSLDELQGTYNVRLQLVPSTSCPICFRVTRFPVRQDCGHVLCFSCIQHSLSSLGNCPLCQAQQIFEADKIEVVPVLETMGLSNAEAGQDLHLPDSSSAMFPTAYQGAIIQSDHVLFNNLNYSNDVCTAMGTGYDVPHDLLSSPFQLDTLSDLDDVINLDDLISSDSERPSPPVAARTSLSGSFVAGPARDPRTSLRKANVDSFEQVSATGQTATKTAAKATRWTASQGGKRKVRTRKAKREELAISHMEWAVVRSEGSPPEPRYDCGLAIHKNAMIVVGGIVGKLRLNDLHVLDLAAKPLPQWTQPSTGGTPPPPGHLLQIFVIGDDLYAIGGTIDGKYLTELHRLNCESRKWEWEKLEVAGNPPSMRYWYSLTVLQGMAILYGGYGHPQRLSDTFALRFDCKIPTWVELHPRGDIPGPSSTHSVCVIKDRMYIFGGYDGKYRRGQLFALEIEKVSNELIDCVWRKVETRGHGPASRYTHSSASIGSRLIVYGGNTGCLKGDAYVLDLGTDEEIPTWKLVKCDSVLTPRAWHRAVVWNDAMYVFGGNTADGNDNNVTRMAFAAP